MSTLGREVGAQIVDRDFDFGKSDKAADVIESVIPPMAQLVTKTNGGITYVGCEAQTEIEPIPARKPNEWMASLPA